jgi:hypothetical protein
MFMIHHTVREDERECLDVKMYESLGRDEDGLVSHIRVYRDDAGRMVQRVLFRRAKRPSRGGSTQTNA